MRDSRQQQLREQITQAFIEELEAFQRGGYQFGGSGKTLFEGTQREAFDAYLDGVKNNHAEGYFEIPTGVGKTALFIAIIGCYLRATENIPDAPRVIIHEPTTDLVLQTVLSFADFMPEIANERTMEADDDRGRELDWESSDIDIHYTKRHGAKNKPKVLITTYQSQAADERKFQRTEDKEEAARKRVYKPEEFGLVIHDEAHYLTGPKFGPAAVDKFKGSIQLGVTATPEYSFDKTVANKLGHRYYHLPLNTAIERGDLCHVRPILIKTNASTKIDLDKARRFLAQQRGQGRPLSNAQLEQLLNQEARNQAIMKAYLTGEHPDTQERFLGQTGMIFAGGIAHCNDFVRDAYKTLEKPAFSGVKKWLREEGLCLIAPVHSAVDKDGVEITIGGEKRQCTKEQIKDLHREGKILLLISDQELKLGTDFPMDSFVADAVDRFSVPDATQRMGRGFRVDRGNRRLGLEANPGKSCAAINVIDETTYEMYKDTPYHPIHAIEILHGAEHRPPGRKKGLTRFREQPPEVSEALDDQGFEFVTKTEAIREVVKRFEAGKKKALPPKTSEWWSSGDIIGKANGNSNRTQETLAALTAAFQAGAGEAQSDGSVVINDDGQRIRLQKLQCGPQQAICFLGKDLVAAGLVLDQALPLKTAAWWNNKDIKSKPGGGTRRTQDAIAALTELFEAGAGDRQADGSAILRYEGNSFHAQRLRCGPLPALCFLGRDLIDAGYVRGRALPPKTDKWWSSGDIRNYHKGESKRTKDALTWLMAAFEAGEGEMQTDGSVILRYEDATIHVQKMQCSTQQAVCFLGKDLVNAGFVEDQELPPKTAEWWNGTDIRNQPMGSSKRTQEAVERLMRAFAAGEGEKQNAGGVVINDDGRRIRLQKMQCGPQQAICFFAKDLVGAGLAEEQTLPPKTAEWWNSAEIRNQPMGSSNRTKEAVDELLRIFDAGEGEEQANGSVLLRYEGAAIHVQPMQSGTRRTLCFLGEDLLNAGLVDAADRTHLKSKRRGKKDLTPGSEDLERGDRSRGLAEE